MRQTRNSFLHLLKKERKKEKRKKSSSKTFRNIRKQISTMKLFYKAYIKKEYDVQVVPN